LLLSPTAGGEEICIKSTTCGKAFFASLEGREE